LRQATQAIHVPIVAIGGITPANAPALLDAGADSLAVLTALFDATDIRTAAQYLNHLFEAEPEE
jgi:thiamine-phosphate pyrophosphorylase